MWDLWSKDGGKYCQLLIPGRGIVCPTTTSLQDIQLRGRMEPCIDEVKRNHVWQHGMYYLDVSGMRPGDTSLKMESAADATTKRALQLMALKEWVRASLPADAAALILYDALPKMDVEQQIWAECADILISAVKNGEPTFRAADDDTPGVLHDPRRALQEQNDALANNQIEARALLASSVGPKLMRAMRVANDMWHYYRWKSAGYSSRDAMHNPRYSSERAFPAFRPAQATTLIICVFGVSR